MKKNINHLLLTGLMTASCMHGNATGGEKKMNVVLIMADDFGYECVTANGGNSYLTPHIDRLAEKGIRFNYCYSNPLSTPSRVQLMTGKYNVRNYVAFGVLDRGERTFGNLFQEAGYATCIAGKWQLGRELDSPQHFGFEQSCLWQHANGAYDSQKHDSRYANPIMEYNSEKREYTTGEFGPDVACDFLIDFIRENKDKPFLAYYPMILTHCPFVATPDSEGWEAKRSPTYKGDPQYFPDMVQYADKLVGRIVDEIEALGLTDNTVIIFTGDNGTDAPIVSLLNGREYPGGKGKTNDSGIHVPLIIAYPGGHQGVVNENLVDFTDFLPTLCEVAGIDYGPAFQTDGYSLFSQFTGEYKKIRDWSYCWYSHRDVDDKKAKVFARNHQYKLYRSGELYDTILDFNEQYPLPINRLTPEQEKEYLMLKEVIEKYNTIRVK